MCMHTVTYTASGRKNCRRIIYGKFALRNTLCDDISLFLKGKVKMYIINVRKNEQKSSVAQ